MNPLAPPYPVPEPLKCWQPVNMPGWWMIAFIAPDWRHGCPLPSSSTTDGWREACDYLLTKASQKGYTL